MVNETNLKSNLRLALYVMFVIVMIPLSALAMKFYSL